MKRSGQRAWSKRIKWLLKHKHEVEVFKLYPILLEHAENLSIESLRNIWKLHHRNIKTCQTLSPN
jgi:hypothetical protein